jgi:ABC-type amino acid transport substrate-binding protein
MQPAPRRAVIAACAIALLGSAPRVLARPATGQSPPGPKPAVQAPAAPPVSTLSRVRESGRLRLGYRTDARPFAFQDESGRPAGYSVALCERIVGATQRELGLGTLNVQWVPVSAATRFEAVQRGEVDILCGAETVTLARRAEVSFSIPIFPGGLGALVRADSPARLREVLSGRGQVLRPVWRASAVRTLQARAFSAVSGTTTERWLNDRIRQLQVIADVSLVASYDSGFQQLLERRSDAFFGERAVLLDAARRHPSARDLLVIDRLFTFEPLALACARGDEELRLFIDRTLSRFYTSGELGALYATWFGEPDDSTLAFFRWNTLPE